MQLPGRLLGTGLLIAYFSVSSALAQETPGISAQPASTASASGNNAEAGTPATGQSDRIENVGPPATTEGFFHSLAHDQYRIWTAPFRPGNYDSHSMKKYGLPFLLISAGMIASDRKTS
jgi:hypothetical protein